ncbi:27373_t:CDS:1, partial [Racocetra persica]
HLDSNKSDDYKSIRAYDLDECIDSKNCVWNKTSNIKSSKNIGLEYYNKNRIDVKKDKPKV